MRRADDMADAIVGGHASHPDGGGKVRRPVIHAGQKVVVQVNHSFESSIV
jgi:hypothetical protein